MSLNASKCKEFLCISSSFCKIDSCCLAPMPTRLSMKRNIAHSIKESNVSHIKQNRTEYQSNN